MIYCNEQVISKSGNMPAIELDTRYYGGQLFSPTCRNYLPQAKYCYRQNIINPTDIGLSQPGFIFAVFNK